LLLLLLLVFFFWAALDADADADDDDGAVETLFSDDVMDAVSNVESSFSSDLVGCRRRLLSLLVSALALALMSVSVSLSLSPRDANDECVVMMEPPAIA